MFIFKEKEHLQVKRIPIDSPAAWGIVAYCVAYCSIFVAKPNRMWEVGWFSSKKGDLSSICVNRIEKVDSCGERISRFDFLLNFG